MEPFMFRAACLNSRPITRVHLMLRCSILPNISFCFCGSGSRFALAARTLRDMGFECLSHVTSSFPAIKKIGGHTEGGA